MPAHALIFIYVASLLTAILMLTLYSLRRRRRFNPEPTVDRIFRCEKCGFVYTDDPDMDRSRCSQCGAMNDAILF